MARQRPGIGLVRQIADDFFGATVDLEDVRSGVSTFVYRIKASDRVYYLRILPEHGATFAGEVKAHELLTNLGAKVPRVVHFEPCNSLTGLSLMITEEVPGTAVQDSWPEYEFESIVQEAGKQLALIHKVPVNGYGWVKREENGGLAGEVSSFRDLYYEHLAEDLKLLSKYLFSTDEVASIERLVEKAYPLLRRPIARLVHGDFDLTHIFHHRESFSGIIDFGEIMGHSPLYDLGHFRLQDGVDGCPKGFEPLLAGYREVTELSHAELLEVELWALLIGIRRLGMLYNRPRNKYHAHFVDVLRQGLAFVQHLL